MGAVDPKDMTAGELLRWAANGEPYNNGTDENNWMHPVWKIGALIEAVTGEWPSEHRVLNSLADKIDAEIEAARCTLFKDLIDSSIELHGYPSRREDEPFVRWLERCWLPRPRFEDEEPVQFGDETAHLEEVDEIAFCRDGSVTIGHNGSTFEVCNHVERPAPDVLGADGLPIVEGDVVYELGRDDALTVYDVNAQYIHAKKENGAAWNNLTAEYLTHTPPDTQERIDEDAQKSTLEYWGCRDASCECCPAETDGKTPRGRFDARNCQQAQLLDLLRRQRELDACKGGE